MCYQWFEGKDYCATCAMTSLAPPCRQYASFNYYTIKVTWDSESTHTQSFMSLSSKLLTKLDIGNIDLRLKQRLLPCITRYSMWQTRPRTYPTTLLRHYHGLRGLKCDPILYSASSTTCGLQGISQQACSTGAGNQLTVSISPRQSGVWNQIQDSRASTHNRLIVRSGPDIPRFPTEPRAVQAIAHNQPSPQALDHPLGLPLAWSPGNRLKQPWGLR